MSSIVRPTTGEIPQRRGGLENEGSFYARILIGEIKAVNPIDGTINVYLSHMGVERQLMIPIHGMSINKFGSSWIRYMPQKHDFVTVGITPDNQFEVLGYTAFGGGSGSVDGLGSYALRAEAYRAFRKLNDASLANGKDNDGNDLGLDDFVRLRPGEWDMRSSGGAYIHGSRAGQLTLAGNTQQLVIDSVRTELRFEGNLSKIDTGTGTALSVGTIKRRLLPTDFADGPVLIPGNEIRTQVADATTGLSLYESIVGDVRQATDLYAPSLARLKETVQDATGLSDVYTYTVDNLGNVSLSGTALTVSAPLIQLGSSAATSPAVKGDALSTYLTTTLSVLTAFGPSGPAIVPLTTELSAKVFLE